MRAKIIFPNLLIVILMGVVGYFLINVNLTQRSTERLKKHLTVVARLVDRSEALHGYEMLNNVRKHSMTKVVTSVFDKLEIEPMEGESQKAYESRIRNAWFKKAVVSIETYSEMLLEKNKKPALLFITDRNGVVLARNTTPNACPAGKPVADAMPVVQRALDGEASYSIWSVDNSSFGKKSKNSKQCSLMNTGLLEIAAAPIWGGDDDVVGVLAVGYEVSNGAFLEKSKAIGLDLAIIESNQVYSSSFLTDTARQELNAGLAKKDVHNKIEEAFKNSTHSDLFEITVKNKKYLALVSPVVNTTDNIAFVYMGSFDDFQYFKPVLQILLVIIILTALFVIIIGFILANYFMKPVVAIEEGLLKVINGEYNYRFDVKSSEVGGLSYRINQLINVLTDQDEDSDDQN
jgi:hypothetical protein